MSNNIEPSQSSFVSKTFLFKWLLKSIPEELLGDPNSRSESIVLLFILFCNFAACVSFVPILLYGFDQTPAVREFGMPMLLGCIFNYIVAAAILFQFKSVVLAGNISLIGPYLCSVYAGWQTGGVFSPMLFLLLVPSVFAFVLTNVSSGITWFTLTIITFFTFWFLDEFDIYNPVFMITDSQDYSLMQLLLPITTCFMIMIAVAIYEANSIKLKRLLAQERNVLAFKAAHDPLTGLANREEFNTQINMAIASARRSDYPLSLAYIDLDGFKPINDDLGHHAGDQVLVEISKRLRAIVRGTDTVARLGGDEFAVILQGVGGREHVEPILQKLLQQVASSIVLDDGKRVNVYASIGVAFLELHHKGDIDGETLCRQADSAMYLAKEEKNTWRFYEDVLALQPEQEGEETPAEDQELV